MFAAATASLTARGYAQRVLTQSRATVKTASRWASSSVSVPKSKGVPIPSSFLRQWYNVFGKSSAMYGTWLILGVLVGEFVFGSVTDGLWALNNSGKTFQSVDWSKFDEVDDDDEEEEDDDDDDE